MIALVALPAWTFAAVMTVRSAQAERERVEAAGRALARSTAAALDFRLGSIRAAAAVLATSQDLDRGSFATFYAQATAFGQAQRVNVALVSAEDGRQIINTSAPFGTALPAANEFINWQRTVQSREPTYSSLFWGGISNQWLTTLAMPVIRADRVPYVLIAAASADNQWNLVIDTLDLPKGWIISVLDQTGTILARRPDSARFIGQPVHPDMLPLLSGPPAGWNSGKSREGKPVYAAFDTVQAPGWRVLVGIPAEELDDAVVRALVPLAASGIVVLAVSLFAAGYLGRRIAGELGAIAKAGAAFRTRQQVAVPQQPIGIAEIVELQTALDAAQTERARNEDKLNALLADKDLLMQEIHHRVKNSLQLVRGILSLQARSATAPEAKEELTAAAARIVTVAQVHQHLYQGSSAVSVNIRQYLSDLAQNLGGSLVDRAEPRMINVVAPDAMWPSERVIAMGLIFTELVTNAIKYGTGRVDVTLNEALDGSGTLVVEDEGDNFARRGPIVDTQDAERSGRGSGAKGLGSKLITSLVRDDEGRIAMDHDTRHTRIVIEFAGHWRRRMAPDER